MQQMGVVVVFVLAPCRLLLLLRERAQVHCQVIPGDQTDILQITTQTTKNTLQKHTQSDRGKPQRKSRATANNANESESESHSWLVNRAV